MEVRQFLAAVGLALAFGWALLDGPLVVGFGAAAWVLFEVFREHRVRKAVQAKSAIERVFD